MKKFLTILFLFPLVAGAQTLMIDDDKIQYKGKIKTTSTIPPGQALRSIDMKDLRVFEVKEREHEVEALAGVRINSPYPIIRQFNFRLRLQADDGGYAYTITDGLLVEEERGGKKKEMNADDLMDKMEDGGVTAIEMEHQMNEADMKIQKMLVLLRKKLGGG